MRRPPRRRRARWHGAPAGLAAAAVLLLAGCGSGSGEAGPPPGGSRVSVTAPDPATEPAGGFGPPVAVRALGGTPLRVTLLRVLDPVEVAGTAPRPAEGHRYVAAELRITDRGAEPHRETPADGTTLLDASGTEWAAGTRDVVGPGFGSATIGPGASRSGWVTFEPPRGARPIRLRFVADGGFGGAAEWRLP